jgi:hypothetical protein
MFMSTKPAAWMKFSLRIRTLDLMMLLIFLFVCVAQGQASGTKMKDGGGNSPRQVGVVKLYERPAVMTLRGFDTTKIRVYEETFVIAYNRIVKSALSNRRRNRPTLTITNIKYISDSVSTDASTVGEINVLFLVTFECNYCNDDTKLFKNPASTRRLEIKGEEERDDVMVVHRQLVDALVAPDAFVILFNKILRGFGKGKNRLIPATQWSEDESCDDVEVLTSSILISTDSEDEFTAADLASLAQDVQDTYNTLNAPTASRCDKFLRKIISAAATLVSICEVGSNTRNLATTTLSVSVVFNCKSCPSGTKLFTNDASRRDRQLAPCRHLVATSSEQRSLVTTSSVDYACTCPPLQKAPTSPPGEPPIEPFEITLIKGFEAELSNTVTSFVGFTEV